MESTENEPKNSWRRFIGVDSVILAVSSTTLVVSLFLLIADDGSFGGSYSNLVPVGSFTQSKNDVRRRVDAGLTWGGANETDRVYEGDSIFTGDQSEAEIKLESGAVLKVEPKSLVVVRTRGKKLEINLQYGSLQGKIAKGQDIVLNQDGVAQELSGESAELRIVKDAKSVGTRIQVVNGEIETNDGKTIKRDEEVRFDKEGSKVSKSDITNLAPANGDMVWLALGKTIPFKWKSLTKNFAGTFEIGFDPGFSSKVRSIEVSGNSLEVGDSKEVRGTLYWRVRSSNPNAAEPPTWKISIYDDVPPLPVLPSQDRVLRMDMNSKKNELSAYLTWEDSAGSSEFELEVAKTEDMKNPLLSKKTRELVHKVDLAEGDYFWRVKGLHPKRKNAPWSRTMHFSVRPGERDLEAPQLLTKKLDYRIPPSALSKIEDGAESVEVANAPAFEWSEVPGANSYEAEIAADESFVRAEKVQVGSSPRFSAKNVRPGKVFFRVRALSSTRKEGKFSEPARMNVELPPPQLSKIAPKKIALSNEQELEKAKHDFEISWQALPFAAGYELIWGADPAFSKSKAFTLEVSRKSIEVTKPREYAAKVRAIDAKGNPLSDFSDVQVAKLEKELKKAELPPMAAKLPPREPAAFGVPAVRLSEPKAGATLVSLEQAPTFVRFAWKPTLTAESYQIQIAEDADFTKIVQEKNVKRSAFVYEDALPEGKIFWRVRAKMKAGFTEWSDVAPLNVLYR